MSTLPDSCRIEWLDVTQLFWLLFCFHEWNDHKREQKWHRFDGLRYLKFCGKIIGLSHWTTRKTSFFFLAIQNQCQCLLTTALALTTDYYLRQIHIFNLQNGHRFILFHILFFFFVFEFFVWSVLLCSPRHFSIVVLSSCALCKCQQYYVHDVCHS